MVLDAPGEPQSPGTAGALSCPAPTERARAEGTAQQAQTPRQQLQRLEALAQAELAQLELMAGRQAVMRHSLEQASLCWDLGLDARDLAPASAGHASAATVR
ncbi:hypothetical protein CXF96_15485 [Stenotrophomonas sp. Betaine-02u-21]|nr:hypothetical protein CXF96_15485 [Stenotrophomonas sp. Betaine-02u-21]PKH74018.1 hypothetical protein CXF90_05280 [Stenotrophomonas sp. Betaine-02u-23]PKH95132.1 hypothetical protein CXG43_13825 [Stenotrophomonas sp. Bg11-02]